jgi:signal transduction histidine kinase
VVSEIASIGSSLRPRARLLKTLGEELISSEIVAVLELVKNSYDADARVVLVRFVDSLEAGSGSLEVSDDGHGMDLATVKGAWMEPATGTKRTLRSSQYLKRRLLGEKGIGRFASARLASELELITRIPKSEWETYAFFDWTQFDRADLYLDEVLILVEERSPQVLTKARLLPVGQSSEEAGLSRDGTHGTVLRMNRLKRSWGDKEIGGLRRALSRLVSPFHGGTEFQIFLQMPSDEIGGAQEVEPPRVINFPHYSVEGSVDAAGKYALKIELKGKQEHFEGWFRRGEKSELIDVSSPDEFDETSAVSCGPFSFKILVWDRDDLEGVEQKLGVGLASIRRDLDSIAGISIYRDGFRVLPYGEPENDWLRLDIRRVQNPTMRLSNNQLTGFISIGADENPLLRDQSNREGLDNNDAYTDLQGIMLRCLSRLEELRYQDRRDHRAAPPKPGEPGGLLETPDLSSLRRELLSKLKADDEAIRLFDNAAARWEHQIVQIRTVLSRYHTLATLGQLIDKVVHDSRQPLSTIQGQAGLAQEGIEASIKDPSSKQSGERLKKAVGRIHRVRDAASIIDRVLNRIEPLGGRRRGKPGKVYVEDILREAFSHFEHEVKDLGIKVKLPSEKILVRVDKAELEEVIINLLSNSIYWLRQAPKAKRAILVECTRNESGEVEILFADSGPGIPKKIRQSIFEPYFTTKPDGVGLGLVIAGEIVRDFYGGSLELLDASRLGGAVFRIVLRNRI